MVSLFNSHFLNFNIDDFKVKAYINNKDFWKVAEALPLFDNVVLVTDDDNWLQFTVLEIRCS